MLLDVLAKVRQFCVPAFFLTMSAIDYHEREVIQVLTDDIEKP